MTMDKHVCPVCGKQCASAGGLSSHMRSHSEEEIAEAKQADEEIRGATVGDETDDEPTDSEKTTDESTDPKGKTTDEEDESDNEPEDDVEEDDSDKEKPEEPKDGRKNPEDVPENTEEDEGENEGEYRIENVTAKNPFTHKHTIMVNRTKLKPGGKMVLDNEGYKNYKAIIANKNTKLGQIDYLQEV